MVAGTFAVALLDQPSGIGQLAQVLTNRPGMFRPLWLKIEVAHFAESVRHDQDRAAQFIQGRVGVAHQGAQFALDILGNHAGQWQVDFGHLQPDQFRDQGHQPVLFPPGPHDALESRARPLAKTEQLEHLQQVGVARVADAALVQLLARYPQQAGVAEDERVLSAYHRDRARGLMVGMHQAVHQGFAQGFVDVRFTLANAQAVGLERNVQFPAQPREHRIVEVEQVRHPLAVQGQPVHPAGLGIVGELFLVVQLVVRQGIQQAALPAEHQQAAKRQAFFSGVPVAAPGSDAFKEGLLVLGQKRVIGVACRKAVAEGGESGVVEVAAIEAGQDLIVLGVVRGVAQHLPHLRFGTAIVTFVITLVAAIQRVAIDVHRTLLTPGAGHLDDQDFAVRDLEHAQVAVAAQGGAELLRVVVQIPERLAQGVAVRQGLQGEGTPSLHHAEHDAAAFAVGHGRQGLPQRSGQATRCRLELGLLILAKLQQVQQRIQIEGGLVHGLSP